MSALAQTSIHWRAPILMISSLLVGAGLVLGHHFFYASLSGRPVFETQYDQQWNIRFGTAFSYLVRCALVIAIGVSYWQSFWNLVVRRPLPISTIDALAGGLNDLTDALHPHSVRTTPLLFTIGVVSWLVPLAAVIPPATLTVLSTDIIQHDMQRLPTISWTSESLFRASPYQEPDSVPYNGPAKELSRSATSIATQGELPSIAAPITNASYYIQFAGPSLRCEEIPPLPVLDGFNSIISGNISCPYDNASCYTHYGYLSWVPNKLYNAPSNVPFDAGSMNMSGPGTLPIPLPKYTVEESPYLGSFRPNSDDSPAALFVASRLLSGNWNLLNCSLWNATYTVDMDFTESKQNIAMRNITYDRSLSLWFAPKPQRAKQLFGYYAMMESIGKVLVGSVHWTTMDETSFITTTSAFDTELVYTSQLFPIYKGSLIRTEVQIPRGNGNGTYPSTVSLFDTNSTDPNAYKNRHLGAAIEQLFTNMTLSLFAKSEFLRPSESETNVTTHLWHNVYHYSPSQLWLSYGLALAATFFVVLSGLITIWLNQASYSNKFSTLLRTTCEDEVCSLIRQDDRTGIDPLPAYIQEEKIVLGSRYRSDMQSESNFFAIK